MRRNRCVCYCGDPLTSTLYFHFRYPRASYSPDCVDPWYVHGSAPTATCGSPACEAEGYAEVLEEHPDADIVIYTEPGQGIFVIGDEE